MKKQIIFLFLMLPLICCAYPVYPQKAESLQSFEIGDFIKLFMQIPTNENKDFIAWDTFVNNENFIWETDGVDSSESDDGLVSYYRNAMVRINVNGLAPLRLKQNWTEMPWSVGYSTTSNPNFGAEVVSIDNECFGYYTTNNCILPPFKSLKRVNINYKKICKIERGNGFETVGYELSSKGLRTIYLLYEQDGGTGGSYETYHLYFRKPENLCES